MAYKYFIWKAEPPLRSMDTLIGIRDGGAVSGIPMNDGCPEYVIYQAWLAEGNTPEEWNPDAN